MPEKSKSADGLTRLLWVCAVLGFIAAEAQVIVAYLSAPTPHSPYGMARLVLAFLVVSIPGIADLKGYFVVRGLSSEVNGGDETKFLWLARNFLIIIIFAYAAIGWAKP